MLALSWLSFHRPNFKYLQSSGVWKEHGSLPWLHWSPSYFPYLVFRLTSSTWHWNNLFLKYFFKEITQTMKMKSFGFSPQPNINFFLKKHHAVNKIGGDGLFGTERKCFITRMGWNWTNVQKKIIKLMKKTQMKLNISLSSL